MHRARLLTPRGRRVLAYAAAILVLCAVLALRHTAAMRLLLTGVSID